MNVSDESCFPATGMPGRNWWEICGPDPEHTLRKLGFRAGMLEIVAMEHEQAGVVGEAQQQPRALAGHEQQRVLVALVHVTGAHRVPGVLAAARDAPFEHPELHAVHVQGMRHRHHARAVVGELPNLRGVEPHDLVTRDRLHLEAAAVDAPLHLPHGEAEAARRIGIDRRARIGGRDGPGVQIVGESEMVRCAR